MRQKLFIFLALILLVIVMVGLNAASYTQKDKIPDNELDPNRSTYNTGATGTSAFYNLLAETGRRPVRWQEKISALLLNSKNKPQTFVVIGTTRREFTEDEIEQLQRWVWQGGKLVIIDRSPRQTLLSTSTNWQVSVVPSKNLIKAVDPSNQQQMTNQAAIQKPIQPTIFTSNINSVQPSQFASSIKISRFAAAIVTQKAIAAKPVPTATVDRDDEDYDDDSPPPPAASKEKGQGSGNGIGTGSGTRGRDFPVITAQPTPAPPASIINKSPAPVIHIADAGGENILLADYPYGAGQIVYLTDPYIVSNAGISILDNAHLGVNVVASRDGIIAFDEYHQGFGVNENHLLAYFAETPIPAIFAQLVLLIGVILFTQSRRFARPLPVFEPNRLSKLEYVSAMAELQQRTKAYDLAIESIYTEFRRRVAKFFGADNFIVTNKELANLIGERLKLDKDDIENLMFKCEEIVRGEPTNKREVVELVSRLREIEEKLGLKRNRKQAFRK